jgi:hypothetical protein
MIRLMPRLRMVGGEVVDHLNIKDRHEHANAHDGCPHCRRDEIRF